MLDKFSFVEIPSLTCTLPSRNKLYSKLNPDEQISVRGMRIQEQKMLLQMNQTTQQDDVLNKIVFQCSDKRLEQDVGENLLIIDRDFLLAKIRQITFGDIVKVTYTCSSCGNQNDEEVDLSKLPVEYFPDDFQVPIIVESKQILINNQPQRFGFTLPSIKTQNMATKLAKMLGNERNDRSNLFFQQTFQNLVSINDEPINTLQEKKKLIEILMNAPQSVLSELFKQVRNIGNYGIKTTTEQICQFCGQSNDVFVLNADFFFHTQ